MTSIMLKGSEQKKMVIVKKERSRENEVPGR